jgi:hypothetical protein
MNMLVLGWVLIGLGVLAIVFGIAGGIATMFKEIRRKATTEKSFAAVPLPTEVLKALTEFLNALIKAPVWLALVFIGIFLIYWGTTMIVKP